MKTATGYFPHDFNSRNDDRILELREKYGPAGYAWFFMLCEIMAENEDGCLDLDRLGGYSISMAISKAELEGFLGDCRAMKLLIPGPSPTKITSARMQEHKEARAKMSAGARNRTKAKPATPAQPAVSLPSPGAQDHRTKKPLLEFDLSPRRQIEEGKVMDLEAFKMMFNGELIKTGASWDEVLDKWSTSLMGTNDEFPLDNNQRLKQFMALLRRYVLSWISNHKNSGPKQGQTPERILQG
jgi:hypothetical protein